MKTAGAILFLLALGSACSREGIGPDVPNVDPAYGSDGSNAEQNPVPTTPSNPEGPAPAPTTPQTPDPAMPNNNPDPNPPTGMGPGPNPTPTPDPGQMPTPSPTPTPAPTTPVPSPTPEVPGPQPDPCAGKPTKTVAVAKTSSFKITGATQTLIYEVEVKNCEGKALPIASQNFIFDLDYPAKYSGFEFEILDAAAAATKFGAGRTVQKVGFDIYGNAKANWSVEHTGNVMIATAPTKLVFKVKVLSFTAGSTTPTKVVTYLRAGDSAVVELPLTAVK